MASAKAIAAWIAVAGLGVGLLTVWDIDSDGRRGVAEINDSSNFFIASGRVAGDADLDGIPDAIEKQPWRPGLEPKVGTWRDVMIEALIFSKRDEDVRNVEKALEMVASEMQRHGVYLHFTALAMHRDEAVTGDSLVTQAKQGNDFQATFVRQWVFGLNVSEGGMEVGGFAMGSLTAVEVRPQVFAFHCLDRRGLEAIGSCFSNATVSRIAYVTFHEAAHTFGLCHGHDPRCYDSYPIDEQDAVRASVMAYEAPQTFALSPSQAVQFRQGTACLGRMAADLPAEVSDGKAEQVKSSIPDNCGDEQQEQVREFLATGWPAVIIDLLAVGVVLWAATAAASRY